MKWVQLSLPVCYSLRLAVLGESHEAALKLCRVRCGLINKVQLTFPCHNVLQHNGKMVVLNTNRFMTHALTDNGCRSLSFQCEHMFLMKQYLNYFQLFDCLIYTRLCPT